MANPPLPVVKVPPPPGLPVAPEAPEAPIVLDWNRLREGPAEITDVYPGLEHPVP